MSLARERAATGEIRCWSAEVSSAQGRVPLTLEGPTRTMRGIPVRELQHLPGDRRT